MKSYYICNGRNLSWAIFTDDSSGFCHEIGGHIANVLSEVRVVFVDIFGNRLVDSHEILSIVPCCSGPMTFRKNNLIFLSSTGLFYVQHIYQFAHELCHFMVPDEVCESYRWFEETLCEAMSWYVLLKISERGKTAPIHELDSVYASMNGYVANQQSKRIKIQTNSLSHFISRNLSYFKKECYNRAANASIAYEIFPLFLDHPKLWNIVPHLHTLSDDMPLSDAIWSISYAAGVVEEGGNELIKRLAE